MKRKLLSILLCVAMVGTLFAGCGGNSSSDTVGDEASTTEDEDTKDADDAENAEETEDAESAQSTGGGYQINTELDLETEITLDIVGRGTFDTGEDESIDLLSGLTKPGYNALVERWNELYPNVTLNINCLPWDGGREATITAAMDGQADVLLHTATMLDLVEDLTPYIESDPEWAEQVFWSPIEKLTDEGMQSLVSFVPVFINVPVLWIDTEKFENFGVDLPSDDWTVDEMLAVAEQLTGTDPVTGEQSYGIQIPWAGEGNIKFNHTMLAQIYDAKVFQLGAGETTADLSVDYTSEESIKAFQVIEDIAAFMSPEAREGVGVTVTLDGTNEWAIAGDISPVQHYFEMVSAGLEDRYIAYTWPVIETGENAGKPAATLFDNNISIYNGSDAKEWAWEFIKFLTTDEVAQQWIADTLRYPNNFSAREAISDILDERTTSVIAEILESFSADYNLYNSDAYNPVNFGSVDTNLQTAVEDVVNGRKTPEEAANYMQGIVEDYLETTY